MGSIFSARRGLAALLLIALAGAALGGAAARAQTAGQNPGWFVPPKPGAPPAAHPAAAPAPAKPAAPAAAGRPPTIPQLPPLPGGPQPPIPILGVLSVPDVMRNSVAAQGVEKIIAARRAALNADAAKEQAAWRKLQAEINAGRGHLTPAALHAKELALQAQITKAQQDFRQRNLEIQQSAQIALGQIERMLIAVIRQVAQSHSMNLVLHRAQVALNVAAFDITPEVTAQLNKEITKVAVPPLSATPAAKAAAGH